MEDDEPNVGELRTHLLVEIYNAIECSGLIARLREIDEAPLRVRKEASYYGAAIARTAHESQQGAFVDLGNRTYSIVLSFIRHITDYMGIPSFLPRADAITNQQKWEERLGDIWEACLGASFLARPECHESQDWWRAAWMLDTVRDRDQCRLLACTGMTQRVMVHCGVATVGDVARFWSQSDLRTGLELLDARHKNRMEEGRLRSSEGELRHTNRNAARWAMLQERKGKGKGGKGKGKVKGSEKGKGNSSSSTPPSSGGKSKGKWK